MRPPLSRVRTAVLVLTTLGLLLLAGLPPGPSPLHPASSGYVAAGTTASYGVPLTGHGSALDARGALSRPATLTPQWTNLTPTTNGSPPPRISGAMVYDAEDGYVVLFGGSFLNLTTFHTTYYNDTWALENGKWVNLTAAGPAPSPREGFEMAYDAEDGYVVLFGGHPGKGPNALNDTWTFSSGIWTNITGVRSPPARYWGSMAYDDADGYVVLFGGLSETFQYLNDTWRFLGGSWSNLRPAVSPSARDGTSIMSNTVEGAVDLFGGQNATYLNDTWAYAGGSWTQVLTPTTPDARLGAGLAFDTAAGVGVLFAGFPVQFTPYGTWIYGNGTWTDYNNLPNVPAFNFDTMWGQMAYDPTSQWVVVVPASNPDTYVLNFTTGSGPSPLNVTASVAPLSGTAPLMVTLSAGATGGTPPYSYSWITGDGGTLAIPNATHTFSSAGSYEVELWVNDSGAGRYFQNWPITVFAPLFQAFASAAPNPATVGETVSFTSTVSGGSAPYTFSWQFGDGATAATQDPTHAYSTASTFPVEFEALDSLEAAIFVNFTETVDLTALTVTASASPLTGLAPLPVAFTAVPSGGTAPYTYSWGFGYQAAASTTPNASYTYPVVGVFTANLTVKDSGGGTVSKSWTITAEALPLAVSVAASPTTAAIAEQVNFTAAPTGGVAPYTYDWEFGDQATSTSQDPGHAFAAVGTYNVSLVIHDSKGTSAGAYVLVSVASGAQPTSSTVPVWELGLIVLIVLLLAFLFVFLVWRRRKKQAPPTPTAAGAPPPTGPP